MHMLQDRDFLDEYISTNQTKLTQSYVEVVHVCRKHSIPYIPSHGGLFIWIDLAPFLKEDSQASEMELWMDIFNETGILMTPGQGFGHTGFGKFRVVYPYVSLDKLKVAMGKLDLFFGDRAV